LFLFFHLFLGHVPSQFFHTIREFDLCLLVIIVQGSNSPLDQFVLLLEPCQLLRMLAVLFTELFVRLLVSRNFSLLFREHSVSPLYIRVSVALCPLLDFLNLDPFLCVARLPVCICLFQASNFRGGFSR
jgi:hypothetical protein